MSELEQLLMDHIWQNPGCTAAQCQSALAAIRRPLKENTVRTLLSRLEAKGYVTHKVEGRAFVYGASEPRKNVAAQAVRQILDRFCGGSVEELLSGMVESDVVTPEELKDLAQRIARSKGAKK